MQSKFVVFASALILGVGLFLGSSTSVFADDPGDATNPSGDYGDGYEDGFSDGVEVVVDGVAFDRFEGDRGSGYMEGYMDGLVDGHDAATASSEGEAPGTEDSDGNEVGDGADQGDE